MTKLKEAILNLQRELEQCGLGGASVIINCHNMTPCQSRYKAREIAVGGFGDKMVEAEKIHPYSHKKGGFSWVQLEQEDTRINLFYEVGHC